MLQRLIGGIFGCSHSRTTFPQTPSRKKNQVPTSERKGTYVVCLDCGREFAYDWKRMRVGEPLMTRPHVDDDPSGPVVNEKFAAE